MSVEVYDLEITKSAFTYTGKDVNTQKVSPFILHKDKNELSAMVAHFKSLKGMIGFNNVNFDYPILHYIYKHELDLKSSEFAIEQIFLEAQRLINEQSKEAFNQIIAIKLKDVIVPQLDLFKLWHFNNKARMTSLKSLEIAMGFPNVMDMPIDYKRDDITLDEVYNVILPYNLNDVEATYEFYKRSIDKINLRKGLYAKYNLPCINYPDSKIGEELVLKLYCEATGKDIWETKKLRSERLEMNLGECIFDYINFTEPEFNELLYKFKNKVIVETKGAIAESVVFKGFKYDYGTGGIHGCIKAGVYESDDEYIIIDADVASLYPSIAIVNKLYPEHLGEEFCDIYENGIVKPRLAAKKAGDMVMADGFKLSANSVYGKSNDKHSFLFDPIYTLKTTLNGQLMLSMLCEKLNTSIDLTMLQVNTDGITVKIRKTDLDLYYTICKEWEVYTKLTLEYVEYSKMVIRDVNNYLAVTTKGKVKYKGAFEIDKDYHKDNSFKIIPIALSEYFVKDIPVEETIKNHTNIYDFCGRQKFKGGDYGTISTIVGNKIVVEKQQKNVRYYVSNKGSSFIKNYQKGTTEVINKGYLVTIFNTFEKQELENYNINYSFYIKECYKELDNILDKQLKLF
jgi:hypothetical protein